MSDEPSGRPAPPGPEPAPGPVSLLARAKAVFIAVRGLATSERAAEMDRRCAGDLELRRMVDSLLEGERAPLPFETLADEIVAARDAMGEPADDPGPAGTRIGPYRVIEQLGEGGFGVVYLAEQEEPVRRRVALKVLKLGMDTRQIVARFEAERQALAIMDHPAIARVFDAGATRTGRPYFVMELVRGEPITEYCDRRAVPIRKRLELFAMVCDGVQHAHQKGVIHRDLKPGNVLVTESARRPSPRIIDFGIAKALQDRVRERTLFTEQGQLMGTPAYMSPEQALGDPDIDTRTDVYSLGVLLYELATGQTPVAAETLRSTPAARVPKLLSETAARPPSTRIRPDSAQGRAAALARGTDSARLRATLRRELDWIILKALERERPRRYASAADLAADLARYLSGDAVLAAPPSRWYAMRKSLRRNRGAVAAAAAIFLTLVLGLIGTVSQTLEARREATAARIAEEAQRELTHRESLAREEAQRQRVAAEAAARAEIERSRELAAVTRFQAQMLARVDSTEIGDALREDLRRQVQVRMAAPGAPGAPGAQADAPTAEFDRAMGAVNFTDAATELIDRALLRPAVAEIEAKFASTPGVDAQLRQNVALVYESLGRWPQAVEQLRKAHASISRLEGEASREALEIRFKIAYMLKMERRFDDAERELDELLPRLLKAFGPEHEFSLRVRSERGNLHRLQGRTDEAIRVQRETLEVCRRVLPPSDPRTFAVMTNLARPLTDKGAHDEAESLLREVLRERIAREGPDADRTHAAAHNLGQVLMLKGDLDGARATLEETVAGRSRNQGRGHPRTANSTLLLAEVLAKRGEDAEAERTLLGLLAAMPDGEAARQYRGPATIQLAAIRQRAGRFTEAEATLLEAHGAAERTGEPSWAIDRALQSLYTAWHAADPNAGAEAKLSPVMARLASSPQPAGAGVVGGRGGEP